MWTLTGFADEIGPDLDEQLDTLASEGIKHLELRGVWRKGVLDLTDEELGRIADALTRRGMRVSAIGSPIGKIKVSDPFEPHLERFRRALFCARTLGAPFIRLFSFYVPPGEAERHRNEVIHRIRALAAEAEGSGVTLVHENEKHIYGDIPARCLDLVEAVGKPHFRLAWDPANFVQCGVRPFTEGYESLRPYVAYVHVKDARLATGEVTVAGAGDGEVRPTLRALADSGFRGFFSLEPHLGRTPGYTRLNGAERFVAAARAFKRLLAEEGIPWR